MKLRGGKKLKKRKKTFPESCQPVPGAALIMTGKAGPVGAQANSREWRGRWTRGRPPPQGSLHSPLLLCPRNSRRSRPACEPGARTSHTPADVGLYSLLPSLCPSVLPSSLLLSCPPSALYPFIPLSLPQPLAAQARP